MNSMEKLDKEFKESFGRFMQYKKELMFLFYKTYPRYLSIKDFQQFFEGKNIKDCEKALDYLSEKGWVHKVGVIDPLYKLSLMGFEVFERKIKMEIEQNDNIKKTVNCLLNS